MQNGPVKTGFIARNALAAREFARYLNRAPGVTFALLVSAILVLGVPPVQGQGLGRSRFFNHDNLPLGDGVTTESASKRARFIRVNSPLLAEPDSPIHQPAPPSLNLDSSRLELNLFNDLTLTAAFDKTRYRNGTNFFATGVVDGYPNSRVVLVAEGEVIAASIEVPGLGSYQIRYAGSGLHKVIEVDKAAIPSCGPIKRAPAKPRPIRLRKKSYPPIPGDEPGAFVAASGSLGVGGGSPFEQGLFALEGPVVEPDASSNTNVDVMVVYTPAARTGAGGVSAINTLIDLAVEEANDAYANSLIPVTLNLVFRGEVTYTETGNAATDLTRLQNPADGHMDSVHALRNQYGADIVCLFTETMTTYAGLGYLMSSVSTNFSSYAFSVVRRVYAAGSYTFAHELGHNMGCAHDRQNSSSQGAYPYSYGFRFVGNDSITYRTVMAYAPGTRIPYFSNPNVTYQGVATGAAIGATNAADNASSISNTAPTVSAFRLPVVILSFTTSSNSVSETNASITLNVARTSVTNLSVTVDYATANGTALAGSDYIATNGTLSFAAGETNKTIVVPILDDETKEPTETIALALSNPSVGTLFTSNATVHILDDDASSVGFVGSGFSISESTNVVTIDVVRAGTTNTDVTVNYFTTNGTATVGVDYIATNGILSFAAGETSKTVSVTVLNDFQAENNETFFVRLRSPTNTTLVAGTTNFVVTITTNDSSILSFSSAATTAGESAGTVTLTVNRTGTTNNEVSVDFLSTNGTATAGSDYTSTNASLTFAPGETSKTFTVDVLEDDTLETTETFRFLLRNPSDARLSVGTNVVSITDNDASTVGFDSTTNLVSETNGTLTLAIVRAGATNTAVTVDFLTTNGTAAAGSDYTATNGTLSFAAGETTNLVTILLTDDDTQENTETFQLRLSTPSNTAVSTGTNLVTVTDDDGSTVGFTVATISVAEDTNSLAISVVRAGSTNTAVSVRFSTLTNGTATAASDYRTTNGVLSFAAGVTTNTFALTILNDAAAENNETVNLRLSSPTNCSLGTSNLVVTITTNDSSILRFTATTNTVDEGDGTLTLTVMRTGTTNNAVTVDFTTTNVTASSSSDYTATNGTLSFAPGETNQTIVLELTDDDTQESTETFRVVLSNPDDARITFGTNTVTIADDDVSTLGFTVTTNSVSETNGLLTLVIVRSGATNTLVTADFTTTNGTANALTDYGATNGTVTFDPGVTTNLVAIDITDDQSQENTESFQVRLGSVSNSTLAVGTNTVTILDDDTATVAFSVAALSVAESTNNVSITVLRSGATNTIVSVRFSTLTTSTATVGSDYRGTNGVLSFGLGETTNTFVLTILNDVLRENNETVNLRLSNPTNCSLGTSNLVVTITTNDSSVLRFTATTNSVDEGDGTLTLTVMRTGTTNNAVTVDFITTNVTASSSSDYTATNGTLSFAPGETNQTIVLELTDDNTQESTETFRVILSNPVDATITFGTNTVSIANDDVSTLALTTNAVSVSETNGAVTLTVVRSGATNTAVTVDFTTTNVTALAGSDYTATNGTLSFAAGETTNLISIEILDNTTQESTETLQVRLSNAGNTSLGVGTNTITITDEDSSTVGFTVSALSVSESTNSVTLTVVRTGSTNTAVSVNFANATNGTATVSSDYRATNGVLAFAAGVTTNTFALIVLNDAIAENNETINLRLNNPTNCALGTSNLVITITTNDSSVLRFTATTNTVDEADGTLTLTILRTGTTNNAVTVDFTTTNVTASSSSDYTATNGTLSFAPGETNQTIVLELTDDNTQESTETFRVVLSSPNDATIAFGTNIVSITDDDVSTVAFTTNAISVSETNGTVTLMVLRTGATNTAVTVDFTTTNATALAGSDYTATNGTLSFAAGETTNLISIEITDNLSQENTETFQVRLSNAGNTSLGVGTNTITITDEDSSTVGFAVSALSVAESTNSVTLTVVRTGSTNTAVSVNFATATNGTATVGSDYRGTNGILAFAAGVTTNTFTLTVLNDSVPENNETVNLRLTNPTNCALSTSNLVVTITTNDSAVLRFTATTNTVDEADGTLTLTVLRTGTTNNAVTVGFTTTNVTANSSSDYTATNGTLSFAPGETNQTIVLELTDDDNQENTETFRVVLSSPNDATITFGTNIVTILDDDVSAVAFTTNAVTVSETNGTVTLTVVRSGATNTAATVDFTTTNATALAGSDYTATNGTLSFAAGETTNLISIEITDNLSQESTESFQVRLSNAGNTTVAIGTNTVTITDEDASTVGFTVSTMSVSESTNSITLTVVRSGATNTAASVNFSTPTNGTATVGSDYRATNGILAFAAGVTTNTFTLTILNDSVPENNETVNLRLASPTNCTLGTSNLVVTIMTNDSSVLRFTAVTNTVDEGDGTLTLTVLRTGTTNNAVTVGFTTTNVTASSSSDYTATNGTLSFAPGETNQTIVLELTDDDTQESTETFRVVLSSPVDATITFGTNVVTIADDDVSTVAFTTNAVTVSETNGAVTLMVLRSGATNTALTVDFTTTNATALAGSDYTATNGTLSFAAGETTNLISIEIADNLSQENTETFQVRLSNAGNTSVGVGTNVITITDEDTSTVGFAVSSLSVNESTNSVTLTVVRTGSTNTAVSVNFTTPTDGTATVGSDYRATNGILAFAAGVTTNTFTLTILNDSVPENNETVNLRLTSPTNCTLGTSNLVVTITTNDSSVLRFTATTNTVDEADGTLTLTVLRTGTTNNAVTVGFTTTNVTASSSSDYIATNGTLSFAPGETNQTIVLELTDDNTQESTETFRVVLSSPVDATITFGTNTVTITDDDVSTVAFTTNAVTVSETNGTVTLMVLRTGATNTTVTVDFTTTNATALAGSDYTATNGTLSFAAGETTNLISIEIDDNLSQESTETFQVRLSNAGNASLGVGTNTVTITDEDASTVGFTVSTLSVAENTNSVTLTVVRAGSTNTAVSVNFATPTNGTATVGSDYRATNGILAFAAGVTTNTFTLTILNDSVPENNETVNLRLTSPTNCTLGTSNLVVTITTNDSSVLRFTATTNTVDEADGTLTLTILRTGTTNNAVTVDFNTTNVTASSSSDYTATNGTLSFAPGETNQTIVLELTDDNTQESTETFRVVLSSPNDATIAFGTNIVSITDDDVSTVAFTTNAVSVSETNGTVTLMVLRTGATNTAVTVDFTTTNATALAGSDYTATNGTLSFAAGETTNLISIEITDNATQESTETLQVRLSNVGNTSLGVGTNIISITDEDASAVGFTVSTLSVAENTNSVTLTVVRTGATNTAVSVNFASLTNGTATVVNDYRATNGVLAFPAGVTTNTFTLTVINDLLAENNETLNLRLSNPTNCSLGTSNLVVTITTNDSSVLRFTATTNTVDEADGTLTLNVLRTGTTNNAVTVDFTTTNVTASSSSDYTATNGTLSFAPGETNQTIVLEFTDDNTQESTETFRVVLSSPVDATISFGTNTVTITDDDVSTVAFTTNAVTVSETNGTVTLMVLRTGATNTAVTVDFTTTNATALAGSDYTATNGTLSFAAGETTNFISIEITDNATQEATETFQVRLSNASNTSVATGTNVITITDDDGSAVGFTVSTMSVNENTNSVTLTVVRSGATNTAVSVNFASLTNGTATVANDYRATNGVLAFAAGVTTNTFALSIINDAVAENNETINLRLSNPTNCSLGTSNLVLTITTNDSSVVGWEIAATNLVETGGSLTLSVNRTGTTNNVVSVDFTTTNVTATAGLDYTATNGTITFAAGETSKDVTLEIADDDLQEVSETFRLVLSNPSDASLGVGTNTFTITDDDGSSVTITTNAVTVAETNDTVTLVVVRSGATNTAVAVDFRTTNVTASAAAPDYIGTNGTLIFLPGETTNTIDLAIVDDLLLENIETFRFLLSGITNSSLAIATNTVSISDDDYAEISFTADTAGPSEIDGGVTLVVERTGATNTAVSVTFITTNGTATAGSDYTATNGVIAFAPGETNKEIFVAIEFDADADPGETFQVRFTSYTNAVEGTYGDVTVTIADGFGDPHPANIVSISAMGRPSSDQLILHITGPIGTGVVLESTTNFQTWIPLTTNALASGVLDWPVPVDRAGAGRFYRVVPPGR